MTALTGDAQLCAYFDAWNAHAPAEVVASFGPDGVYSDPTGNGRPAPAAVLADHVERLAAGFPDFRFDTADAAWSDDQTAHVPWVLRGTNTRSYNGLPPSGHPIELPGVDIVEVADDGLRRVVRYFDRQTISTQLGLQVHVQPTTLGPFRFGTSVAALPERSTPPTVLAVTWLEARSPEEADEVRGLSRPMMAALCEVPGFTGGFGISLGNRQYTITAWEDRTDIQHLVNLPGHQDAAHRFFNDDFCAGAFTGVWPIGATQMCWRRCPSCSKLTDPREHPNRRSSCGAASQELRPW